MFRRKKDQSDEVETTAEDAAAQEAPAAAGPSRPQGPWDAADAPERNRLDLGALLVPVPPDTEVRVDVSPEGQVVAATLVRSATALQVNAFAAPRTEGIWAEVRAEIGEALRAGGGKADEVEGPFGPELDALVPADAPDGSRTLAPARFLGVDGPRWFLRGLITGAGAVDRTQATELEEAFRDLVVVRGTDPMAVRDPLALRLPPQATAEPVASDAGAGAAGAAPAGTDEDGQALAMPERGPEITEIR